MDSGASTGGVVALGERDLVAPYALAGARVWAADTPQQVRAAWQELTDDVLVVLLTPAAAAVLAAAAGGPMTAVLP
ncbi:hypothetical protein Q6348_07140 [Isoptericola sp. b441]|uniref:Uncharacterized protein n=1 Tax=Actinotalea lenta TaxID=3064654 RepID=A0ABT9D931_9CELL|nr:hypothetical protein [Isoptericola sp. b441]MDO8106971.1 hypothetical protein [Isoptericola sp. b441]